MIKNNLRNEYNNYINYMCEEYIGNTGKRVDDVIYDDDFLDLVEADLQDAGFTNEEASGIAIAEFRNEEVEYKMLAYCYLLLDPFDTIDSLEDVINDSNYSDLSEYTEEELESILAASKRLDY